MKFEIRDTDARRQRRVEIRLRDENPKCFGTDCPLKETCMRYKPPGGTVRVYGDFWKHRNDDGSCDHYLKR